MNEKDYTPIVETPVEVPMFRGRQLFHAPQKALTPALATTITKSASPGTFLDGANDVVIENMRTRIAELENRLTQLELLRSA